MTVWNCHATVTPLFKDEVFFFMLLWNKNQLISHRCSTMSKPKFNEKKGYFCQVWPFWHHEADILATLLINSLLRWALSCNKLWSWAAFLFFLCTVGQRCQCKAEESKFYSPIFVLTFCDLHISQPEQPKQLKS